MESHLAAATQDGLIQSLSHSLPNTANYILSRTNATFMPQGGNTYAPNGVRLIRFQIADSTQFLDPHSVRLMFTLTNDAAQAMQLLGAPMVLFQRCRLLCNGVVVEDLMYSHRLYDMMYKLNPRARNLSNLLEWPYAAEGAADANVDTITAGASKRFLIDLPFGLFKQPLYLMLKACPITLEFELVKDSTEAVCSSVTAQAALENASPAIAALVVSQAFTLSDVQLKADTCTISQDLVERYNQHLLSGRPLPIPFTSYMTQMQALTGAANFNVQVARAFSRLKTVYFTFWRDTKAIGSAAQPNFLSQAQRSNLGVPNYFYYPAPGTGAVPPTAALTTATDTLQWQLMIGAKTWPVYPVRGVSETAYRLRASLDQAQHGDIDLKFTDYISTKFIAAIDVEKAAVGPGAGANFTGVSTRGGEQLLIDIKGFPAPYPQRIYVSCHYDAILNLRAEGVEMLD